MTQLYPEQKKYAREILKQIKENGVALLQLPTGQGKTLIALKVAAEVLSHSRQARPIVLVTRKSLKSEILAIALKGEHVSEDDIDNPWVRDAINAGGLKGQHRGKHPKIGKVECRSAKDLRYPLPIGALVIVDEVHRFQAFLKKMAKQAHGGKCGLQLTNARKRRFLLLSATPINPVRISKEVQKEERSLQAQIKAEDDQIKNSYLDLYKAMIAISILGRTRKKELLDKLSEGSRKTLKDFAEDLKQVMKVLAPVPEPVVLSDLGPRGRTAFQHQPEHKENMYRKSFLGLLGLHQGMVEEESMGYCAERMALAGVRAKRVKKGKKKAPVSFMPLPNSFRKKGLFHHQPSTPYMIQTVRALRILDKNKGEIRRHLSIKIDELYKFLKLIWEKHAKKAKWRVLVYCAHRGSVAALAAILERRFAEDNISCSCIRPTSVMYGDWGCKRVVWSTEGYTGSKELCKDPEAALKKEFSPENKQRRVSCEPDKLCPRGFVLVTSDRLSESIDLHRECEIMIHFDLDWSPLRMIQRYGRLWRIDKPGRKWPKSPAVFHMIQPGSVDEEIEWRLKDRWERLHKLGLGLDSVKINHALGDRIY
jgi:ERCC4-related helicase